MARALAVGTGAVPHTNVHDPLVAAERGQVLTHVIAGCVPLEEQASIEVLKHLLLLIGWPRRPSHAPCVFHLLDAEVVARHLHHCGLVGSGETGGGARRLVLVTLALPCPCLARLGVRALKRLRGLVYALEAYQEHTPVGVERAIAPLCQLEGELKAGH
eukprot:scaffold9845_cov63-Phaeocystis_antarctica.AAC.1